MKLSMMARTSSPREAEASTLQVHSQLGQYRAPDQPLLHTEALSLRKNRGRKRRAEIYPHNADNWYHVPCLFHTSRWGTLCYIKYFRLPCLCLEKIVKDLHDSSLLPHPIMRVGSGLWRQNSGQGADSDCKSTQVASLVFFSDYGVKVLEM